MSETKNIRETLYKLSDESDQEIPKELISEILEIYDKFAQDRVEAQKRTRKIIEDHINSIDIS